MHFVNKTSVIWFCYGVILASLFKISEALPRKSWLQTSATIVYIIQTKYRLWTKGTVLCAMPDTPSVLKKNLLNGNRLEAEDI